MIWKDLMRPKKSMVNINNLYRGSCKLCFDRKSF